MKNLLLILALFVVGCVNERNTILLECKSDDEGGYMFASNIAYIKLNKSYTSFQYNLMPETELITVDGYPNEWIVNQEHDGIYYFWSLYRNTLRASMLIKYENKSNSPVQQQINYNCKFK